MYLNIQNPGFVNKWCCAVNKLNKMKYSNTYYTSSSKIRHILKFQKETLTLFSFRISWFFIFYHLSHIIGQKKYICSNDLSQKQCCINIYFPFLIYVIYNIKYLHFLDKRSLFIHSS